MTVYVVEQFYAQGHTSVEHIASSREKALAWIEKNGQDVAELDLNFQYYMVYSAELDKEFDCLDLKRYSADGKELPNPSDSKQQG